MDYFLLKQSGAISIPKDPTALDPRSHDPSIRVMDDLSALQKFDYIAGESLLSSRLKELIEQYLPEQAWRPCVFINPAQRQQEVFWFLPTLSYQPEKITTASNGTPSAIYVKETDFAKTSPGIFCIRSPKGSRYTIIHLSIAESILRRGICGLELARLSE